MGARPLEATGAAAAVVLIVLTQRLGVPVGGGYVSPALGVMLIGAATLIVSKRGVLDPVRTSLYLAAAAAVLASTLVLSLSGGVYSVTSLGLLVVAYGALCVVAVRGAAVFSAVVAALAGLMTAMAAVAVGQMLAQLSGLWTYNDVVSSLLPEQLLVSGYVTTYPVSYGSSIMRSNAFVFLEPSFCSQFLAVGALCNLLLGHRMRSLWCAVAILTTFSGTGLILLAVGLLAVSARRRARALVPLTLAVTTVVAVVTVSPLGQVYADRITSISDEQSSGYQRFVAPYARAASSLGSSPMAIFVGEGAGAAQQRVDQVEAATGQPAIDPPHTKLVVEYGTGPAAVFIVFVAVAFWCRTPSRSVSISVLVLYFFLSGSLLQVQTLAVCWLLVSLPAGLSPATASSRRPVGRHEAVPRRLGQG